VWNLVDKSIQFIRSPKFDENKGLAFSPSKKIMALAERTSDG